MTIPLVDAIRDLVSRREALARDIAEKIAIFDRLDAEVRQAEEALEVRDRQTEQRQPAEDGGGRLASAVATPAATTAPVPTITPAAAIRVCRLCDTPYVRTSNRQLICPECRAKVAIGTNLEELLARKAKGLPVFQAWADRTCEVETCRKTYTPKNHKQKICDECRATYGPRGPGRINKGIRRAADRAEARRGRATPRLPLTETVPCGGPGARGVEPCPRGKVVSKTKQARGPLRCPDCHLENKRRMVRARLPELRQEQKTRLGKVNAAAAPGGFEGGRLQTWREERANVDGRSAGERHDDRRPAGNDGGARPHRVGRRPSRRAPEGGASDGADRRRDGAGRLGGGLEPEARGARAARGTAEAPMSEEEPRDATPAEDREALETSQSVDDLAEDPAPDGLELGEEDALEETAPAPASRRFFGRGTTKAAIKDPRLRQVKETGYRRNAEKRETVQAGGSWWLVDPAAFSEAAAQRAEELKRSKSSNIIRTPLNFI